MYLLILKKLTDHGRVNAEQYVGWLRHTVEKRVIFVKGIRCKAICEKQLPHITKYSRIFYCEHGAQIFFCIFAVWGNFSQFFYQCTVSIMWEQEEAISENVSDKEREKECTSYKENEEN